MWKEVAGAIAFIVAAATLVLVVSIAMHSWSAYAGPASGIVLS